jgi:hypothetical protein
VHRTVVVLFGVLLLLSPMATAQDVLDSLDPPEGTTDARDLLGRLRDRGAQEGFRSSAPDYRKLVWLRVPFIAASPATGFLMGGGAGLTFFQGDPVNTHASTVFTAAAASLSGQFVTSARVNFYTAENRWFIFGDNRLERASQRSYGLGTSSATAHQSTISYAFPKMYDVAFRRVYKGFYAGVGLHVSAHTGIESAVTPGGGEVNSPFASYSRAHGFNERSQGSAGTSVNALYDSRDSSVNARRGMLVNASYRSFYKNFLGGDSDWQQLYVDVRAYRPLAGSTRHTLAAWAYGDRVTGGVAPYFDLPSTGGDLQGRSGRGYAAGRFRGEQLVYAEAEYRGTITRNGLIGVVAFVNMTTVSNRQSGETLFRSVAPGAGVGFRLLMDKLSRTRVCFDVGIGRQGSRGISIALQEAF